MNIKELRKIAEAATPGPWQAGNKYFGTDKGSQSEMLGEACQNNAAYIATFNPAFVSKLLDVVEAADRLYSGACHLDDIEYDQANNDLKTSLKAWRKGDS